MDIEKIKTEGSVRSLQNAREVRVDKICNFMASMRDNYRDGRNVTDRAVKEAADKIRQLLSEIEALTTEINRLSPPKTE